MDHAHEADADDAYAYGFHKSIQNTGLWLSIIYMDFDGLPIFKGFSGILVAFLVAGILLGSNCDFVRAGVKQQGVTPFPDLLARPASAYPARTVGGKAEDWHRSLMAGVDAGRIDVSRYGAYKRNLAVFVDWLWANSVIESITAETLEGCFGELARRVKVGRYSPDYARSIFRATKRFFAWLAGMKLLPPPANLASKHFRFGPGRTATKEDLFRAQSRSNEV
jgi:hypothetical protein